MERNNNLLFCCKFIFQKNTAAEHAAHGEMIAHDFFYSFQVTVVHSVVFLLHETRRRLDSVLTITLSLLTFRSVHTWKRASRHNFRWLVSEICVISVVLCRKSIVNWTLPVAKSTRNVFLAIFRQYRMKKHLIRIASVWAVYRLWCSWFFQLMCQNNSFDIYYYSNFNLSTCLLFVTFDSPTSNWAFQKFSFELWSLDWCMMLVIRPHFP